MRLIRTAAARESPELETRWNALADLPSAWNTTMDTRFKGTSASKPQALPDTLLNLEVALGLESPPEFEAARRQLKMNALKFAMENRRTGAATSRLSASGT